MHAYPRHIRRGVLAARAAGKSTSQVARQFNVSESWVRRVVQQRRELGKLGPYRYRFRDRHTTYWQRRARYIVLEDPHITVKELERVLGRKLSIEFVQGLKDELDINQLASWYGGIQTQFYLSPTGNYLIGPREPYLDVELELERLKAGEPPYKPAIDWRNHPIDRTKYPML